MGKYDTWSITCKLCDWQWETCRVLENEVQEAIVSVLKLEGNISSHMSAVGKKKTERVIDVIDRKKKRITAYCHMRQDIRTFKRVRIKSITPIQSIS